MVGDSRIGDYSQPVRSVSAAGMYLFQYNKCAESEWEHPNSPLKWIYMYRVLTQMTAPGSGHNGENAQNGRELSRNQGKFPLENKVEFRKNRANSLCLALLRKTSVAMHSFVHGTIYTGSELARRVDFHVSSCVSLSTTL